MPDPIRHILSTGTLADELLTLASRQGMQIDVVPFFRIDFPADKAIDNTILTLAAESRTVIFTSKQAVRAVVARLDKAPDWNIYCISWATQKEVAAFWPHTAIIGVADNGERLAELIAETQPEEELVFFCGKQRMDTLPRILSERQLALREVVVYTTTPTPVALTSHYDAVFFYNPIGVHSFFSANQSGRAILFAIGETTSEAIRSHVSNASILITIAQPAKALMVDTAITYFQTVNPHTHEQ